MGLRFERLPENPLRHNRVNLVRLSTITLGPPGIHWLVRLSRVLSHRHENAAGEQRIRAQHAIKNLRYRKRRLRIADLNRSHNGDLLEATVEVNSDMPLLIEAMGLPNPPSMLHQALLSQIFCAPSALARTSDKL